MSLVESLAGRVGDCADRLSTIDRVLPALGVPAAAFGADSPGSPGRIGRELHRHWAAVLSARSGEAGVLTAHLAEVARSLSATAEQYAASDDTAARRLSWESVAAGQGYWGSTSAGESLPAGEGTARRSARES